VKGKDGKTREIILTHEQKVRLFLKINDLVYPSQVILTKPLENIKFE
jgi:hypothetical protein